MSGHRGPAVVLVACFLVTSVATASAGFARRSVLAQTDWAPPRTVYVPETGHTVDGVFLDFWRSWGGLVSIGYPITEELDEDGRVVQYYGYARLEYWPDDPQGDVVHLGAIGADLMPFLVKDLTERARREGTDEAREAKRALRAFEPLVGEDAERDAPDRRYVSETQHVVQFGFKTFWEATGEAAYLGNPLSEEYVLGDTTYQLFERGLLRWPKDKKVRMAPVGEDLAKRRKLETAPVAQGDLPAYAEAFFAPPPTPKASDGERRQIPLDPQAERWLEVDLSDQVLTTWQGDVAVLESSVSTGKAGFETPPGSYQILSKLESEDMEGVIGGEYYNVPDVPWTMYFTDGGHALHGTYWHANFGMPMSHGCVNLPMDVAAWLFDWAPVGTRVEIRP